MCVIYMRTLKSSASFYFQTPILAPPPPPPLSLDEGLSYVFITLLA